MADDKSKSSKLADDNETLVNALESIKSLLATSEEKLNKARESVSKASAHSLKMTREVPVLDEVVVPGKSLDATQTPAKKTKAAEQKPAKKLDMSRFKAELEQEMRDKLAAYANELEQELKAKIRDYLNKP